jgi:BirA family biotin operon repressor/biotin-[acetyl-CoA-carboxylase] ligase
VCQVVVGVGLNVVPFDAADLDSGFAALCELDPQASLSGALDRVAPALVHALRQFEREGYAAFAARYAARDALRGRNVTAQVAAPGGSLGVIHGGLQEEVHGVAHGVADDGCLRVRTARGEVRVHSGEVRVRVHA